MDFISRQHITLSTNPYFSGKTHLTSMLSWQLSEEVDINIKPLYFPLLRLRLWNIKLFKFWKHLDEFYLETKSQTDMLATSPHTGKSSKCWYSIIQTAVKNGYISSCNKFKHSVRDAPVRVNQFDVVFLSLPLTLHLPQHHPVAMNSTCHTHLCRQKGALN